jgi:hypothetical protein
MLPIDRYTCEEAFRRLDDYLDRRLAPHEMQLVRQHLEICAVCAAEYKFDAGILAQVREKLQCLAAPPHLLAKISRALAEAEAGDDRSKT